ncbi:hypothetical protein MHBO_003911 [Bonamia ostreae]|uniref:TFIIF beta subunit N-terminal domain-containing protein n=1 Tax=Bonamia ostreae TaxID=126728 RepID=A0ABV2ARU4_9EUKA
MSVYSKSSERKKRWLVKIPQFLAREWFEHKGNDAQNVLGHFNSTNEFVLAPFETIKRVSFSANLPEADLPNMFNLQKRDSFDPLFRKEEMILFKQPSELEETASEALLSETVDCRPVQNSAYKRYLKNKLRRWEVSRR